MGLLNDLKDAILDNICATNPTLADLRWNQLQREYEKEKEKEEKEKYGYYSYDKKK